MEVRALRHLCLFPGKKRDLSLKPLHYGATQNVANSKSILLKMDVLFAYFFTCFEHDALPQNSDVYRELLIFSMVIITPVISGGFTHHMDRLSSSFGP